MYSNKMTPYEISTVFAKYWQYCAHFKPVTQRIRNITSANFTNTFGTLLYLLFRRLQYMLIQYRVSNWKMFWPHNDRKSFLSSFLLVTSSSMRTYTSCDDVTGWRQAAFAYAVNMSNALQTEKHLIKMGFRQEIGKINN